MSVRRHPFGCAFVGLVLIAQATMIVGIAKRSGPNADEIAHLASGLYHWQTGRMDAYRVNPPLVRLWSTFPLAIREPLLDWTLPSIAPRARHEWQLDGQLMRAWPYEKTRTALHTARGMSLVFAAIGSLFCWRFANRCGGANAGLAAMMLYAFSPNLLAWHATICPDAAAAALSIAAVYAQQRLIRDRPRERIASGVSAGLWTGLAILAKSTCLLLLPLLWVTASIRPKKQQGQPSLPADRHALPGYRDGRSPPSENRLGVVCVATLVAMLVVHVGYGFDGSGVRMDSLRFESHAFRTVGGFAQRVSATQVSDTSPGVPPVGRVIDRCIRSMPAPLPADMLLGLDCQRHDFETGKRSYLGGQWKERGWLRYYVVCIFLKLPIATLLLFCWSTCRAFFNSYGGICGFSNHDDSDRLDNWPLSSALVPLCGFLALVSSQTGFSHHFRYAFPCLPFIYIVASQACRAEWTDRRLDEGWLASIRAKMAHHCVIGWILVGSAGISSMWQWPMSRSYFSELVGGGRNGYRWLLESNLDWGEDLTLAADWARAHPDARPLFHATLATTIAEYMPCDWQPMETASVPGWYIVSLQREVDPQDECYGQFSETQLVTRLGDSMRVYHVEQ